MTQSFVIGGLLGLGLWLVARGLYPRPPSLADRLAAHSELRPSSASNTVLRTMWGRLAVWVLRTVKGGSMDNVSADLAVVDRDLEAHAVDKLNAGLGGAGLSAAILVLLGVARSPLAMAVIGTAGFVIFYLVPDVEFRRKAEDRRQEFSEALNAFVGLVAVSISGGGGVNSAMQDALSIGGGWSFDALRRSVENSLLHGESPWSGFDELGHRMDVVPLIELAGALSLSGDSGAKVTETLQSRAESGRQRELADAMTAAERKSESMNIPVATMLLGWVGFMGYPAVVNLLGT